MHFLHSAERDETCLLITFGERKAELVRNGSALGFAMDKMRFLDLSPDAGQFADTPDYDIFPPSEVEREPLARRIREEIESVRPSRVLIDGTTQLRL